MKAGVCGGSEGGGGVVDVRNVRGDEGGADYISKRLLKGSGLLKVCRFSKISNFQSLVRLEIN